MFHQSIGNPLDRALDKLLRAAIDLNGIEIKLIAPDPDAMLATPVLACLGALSAVGAELDLIFTRSTVQALNRRAQIDGPALADAIRGGSARLIHCNGGPALVSQLLVGDTLWIEDRWSGMPRPIEQAMAVRAARASFRLVALASRPIASPPKRSPKLPNFLTPSNGHRLTA